jgi:hypothetical protein
MSESKRSDYRLCCLFVGLGIVIGFLAGVAVGFALYVRVINLIYGY